MRHLFRFLLLSFALITTAFAQSSPAATAAANAPRAETLLGPGDVVRITVYQNPDLTVEAGRIAENNRINFPLVGSVAIGGLTPAAAEQRIAKALRDGGFVLKPQVSITVGTIRSAVISVLGQVAKPGRYPIETAGSKASEMVAAAGGALPSGADTVTLSGTRHGKPVKVEIDLPSVLQAGQSELDVTVENGDVLFVDRAPTAYIWGEVARPGQFRLERGMTLEQALAQAGGVTQRGTQRGMKVRRRDADGNVVTADITLNDPVQRDDVIFVKESLF